MDPLAAFRMDDRVVVITGASSGLGARTARVLASAGANVVLAARRREKLQDLAGQIGPRALACPCDVTRGDDLDHLVRTAREQWGRIDVLVNNAGMVDDVAALEESDDRFRQVVDLNLHAAFALSRRVAPTMIEQGSGAIVNVASVLGLVGIGRIPSAGYAASKAGLINLTRELAAQWGGHGLRVNALAPGFFPSELTGDMFDPEGGGATFVEKRTLLRRVGSESDLDGAMLYLASEASAYVTGQVLVVDGGWTAV